ncbi:MAG: endopeptidase La [Bacteroidaceae bacterium]|nr:endopeptidase La [Bacteroidaceae bacterium]
MITEFSTSRPGKDDLIEIKDEMPLLATRMVVVFPFTLVPITVGRAESLAVVRESEKRNMPICIATQIGDSDDVPTTKAGISDYGVYGKVVKVLEIPGQGKDVTAFIQSYGRCLVKDVRGGRKWPFASAVEAPEDDSMTDTSEYRLTIEYLSRTVSEYIHKNDEIPDIAIKLMSGVQMDVSTVNYYCSNIPFGDVADKLELLAEASVHERAMLLIRKLNEGIRLCEIKRDIREKTSADLSDEQREYFLHQQLRTIKEELGDGDYSPEQKKLLEKAEKKKWSKEMEEFFMEEFDKCDILNPHTPDYSTHIQYLQTLVDLPWNEYTEDNLSLQRAEKVLNRDHYGMEKVKERILEYMAVLSLKRDMKSPILCLYGPPGVGKTSLGKSIAASLGRKYVRMSFGGLHDESEIRGHRRTYVGAMPGRVIKGILKAGSSNPVFVLDEIDKVSGSNYHGDPSSALLEVLDPEQNMAFHDNYLDVDYDLSKVLFIATANDLSTIPTALRDRMEVIEVSGYITEEKIEIAKRHLIPKEKENNGLKGEKKLSFNKASVERIIENYTRESGVRQLERQINKAFRKLAYRKAYSSDSDFDIKITPNELEDLLGKPPFYRDIYQGNDCAGVVTGLAWTSVGGEILFVETSLSRGKEHKLTLTGNLGDVMKESAALALEYVKAHADTLNIDYRIFDHWNIHIHVPEGATPKDGPSAGITIATSIASALTQRKVRKNTAMTGEITLRGKVLPVGGIKEKILAAKRAGITDIVMCRENRKDVEEIQQIYLKGLDFHYVEDVQEVWAFALTDEIVDNPVTYSVEEGQGYIRS